MTPVPTYVQNRDESDIMFSVCSLVRDQKTYDRLLESFGRFGFTPENFEFLAVDNREGNQFDGFNWHKHMWPRVRGRYVVFCHNDVELVDNGCDELVAAIEALEAADPNWLVAGNAGCAWHPLNQEKTAQMLHISDVVGKDGPVGQVPTGVETPDESFILMRHLKPVLKSGDPSGFHSYGADLCLEADLLSGRSYAIDFHLLHKGRARADESFAQMWNSFRQKYRRYGPGRILHCVSGRVAFGGAWHDAI